MADNDPYYDSRFLADGTNQAELIYNELIGRQKAAHGTIKSRSISVPPVTPVEFNGYLVPTGATGAWTGLDGNIVFWINAWIVLVPKLGMSFLIEDEDMLITVDANNDIVALDGCQTITPDGSGNIVWNVEFGSTAYVTLTLANNELKAPIGMKAGRVYSIFFVQSAPGLEVHFEPGQWTDLNGGDLDTGVLAADKDHFGFIGPSCAEANPVQIWHTGDGSSGVGLHASTHSLGGSDVVTVENLRTGSTDTSFVLSPAGGNAMAMGPIPLHAATRHQHTQADPLILNTQSAGSSEKHSTLQPKLDGSVEWLPALSSRAEGTMTGILTGWSPNGITGGGTTVNLTAGVGRLVDNATVEVDPSVTEVTGGPYGPVAVTDLATKPGTFFYVDSAGLLQQQSTTPTLEEHRSRIYVMIAEHPNGTVTNLYSMGVALYEGWRVFHDFLRTVGLFNVEGNDYSRDVANALGIQVNAGVMFFSELNRDGTAANRRKPNNLSQSAAIAISFLHIQNDGSGGVTVVTAAETDIDDAQIDDGAGGLTALANNRNTINIIYRDPAGSTVVQYTQIEFNPNSTSAQEQLKDVVFLLAAPWIARYAIDIPKDVGELNDATFIELAAFGTAGGGSSGGNGGGAGFPTYLFPARRLVSPLVADWTVNALAPLSEDPDNAAIQIIRLDDTVEQGGGLEIFVPTGATNMILSVHSRPISGPAGAVVGKLLFYERGFPNTTPAGAGPTAWSSAIALDDVNYPVTTTLYHYDITTKTLAAWGLTAGEFHQCEITRTATADTVIGDIGISFVLVEFS